MTEFRIDPPELLHFPTPYKVIVKPDTGIVLSGTKMHVTVTYEDGGTYDKYKPVLVLLRSPDETPEKPKLFGTLIKRRKQPTFEFTFVLRRVGMYVLRLRAFGDMEIGDLIEIHVASAKELKDMRDFLKREAPKFV